MDVCVHCAEQSVSVLRRGERSLCLWYHHPPSTSSFHNVSARTQTLMHYCLMIFLNLKPSLSLSVCVSVGHELLSELQQRRFNGSEGGGAGQGGEKTAVTQPDVTVLDHSMNESMALDKFFACFLLQTEPHVVFPPCGSSRFYICQTHLLPQSFFSFPLMVKCFKGVYKLK